MSTSPLQPRHSEPTDDASATDRLTAFLRPYAATFRRRDQARWFELYIRGLLEEGPRKTIEAMVRQHDPGPNVPIRDLSQALQNFVNQSPWDEGLLWRQLRRTALERLGDSPVVAVLDEVSIVKQGQHSVGVQRQYAGDGDRKQNCQVAVVLSAAIGSRAFPLGCRLYLPRNWATDPDRLRSAGVPEEHHGVSTRGEVGLKLLDEAMADGIRFQNVVATSRYAVTGDFRRSLALRTPAFLVAVNDEQPVVPDGESPHPWRNSIPASTIPLYQRSLDPTSRAALASHRVRLTEDEDSDRRWLIVEETPQGRNHYLAAGPAEIQTHHAASLLNSRSQTQAAWQLMKSRLGLDHFEGRSWRGFHHHATLVALAYAHLFFESKTDTSPSDVVF